jgi:APA family basic amino acid/polyamine antiporter
MIKQDPNQILLEHRASDLPRVLGLKDAVGIVVGTMIGSGIFIVPATIADAVKAPLLLLLVWVAGGVLTFFGALSLAELGAAFPQAGGMYVFLRESYGRLIAFLFGWTLFLIIDSGSMATLAVAFSSKYLPQFVGLSRTETKAVAVALVLVLAVINYVGVRWGALVQNILTVIKFSALVGVCAVVFLFARGNPSHFVTPSVPAFSFSLIGAFGVGLVGALWALKGWEVATFSAGELRNPEKNLPRGILVGTLMVLLLYLAANLAYLYAVPVREMAKSSRIASDAMNIAIGPVGASLIALAILFSITGAANGHLLTGPRVYFAMARDGLFFKKVAEVHPRFLTPHVSIIALGIWSSLLCLSGTFEQLFTYVVFGLWIFFGLTVGAVIILRKKRPELERPYKTWGYPWTPALFILAALFISVNTLINRFWNSFAGLLIIFLGLPAYFYWKKRDGSEAKPSPYVY